MPISPKALDQSVIEVEEGNADLAAFLSSYLEWKKENDQDGRGYFSVPVAKLLELMEKAKKTEY